MLELYPSTIRTGRVCFNLVVRAAIVTLAWAVLLSTGLALNLLVGYTLGLLGAHESLKTVSSFIVQGFFYVWAVATTITSLSDVFALVKAALTGSSESNDGSHD
jgi:hypothetical protein